MFLSIKDDFLERNKCLNAIHLIQKVSQNYDSRCYINLVDCINSRATYFYDGFHSLNRKTLIQWSNMILEYDFPSSAASSSNHIEFDANVSLDTFGPNIEDNIMADDQIVDFEPAIPQQNFNQEEFTSFDQNIQDEVLFTPNQDQLDLESKGIEKLKNLLRVSEYSDKT